MRDDRKAKAIVSILAAPIPSLMRFIGLANRSRTRFGCRGDGNRDADWGNDRESSFEVIRPLFRCQVYVLKSMEKKELEELLNRALTEDLILKNQIVEESDAYSDFRR